MGIIGIDTIRIRLKEGYEISKNAKLTISSEYNLDGEETTAEKLFETDDGVAHGGRKSFINVGNLNLDILRGFGGTSCFVHFSIPKVFDEKNNSKLLDRDQTVTAIKKVETDLRDLGIKTKLFKGKISRLDVCRNIVSDYSYREYDNIFRNLQMNRAIKRELGNKVDTHLWKNTQQEICVYDKYSEMQFKKHDVKDIDRNTVRCELRLMKSKKVQTETKFKNVWEMVDRYDEVKEMYVEKMKTNIFKYNVQEFETKLSDEIKLLDDLMKGLNYFKHQYKRNWINEYIKACGTELIEKVFGFKIFDLGVRKATNKRSTIHYVTKNYNKKIFENSMIGSGLNPVQLYNELKYKICEAA